ncbi:MAG: alpha-ketoacid dehydrogenase subunit beta [Acidobacteria bacterium]|nr:MAG: alpha-ketoacid dehydrogenase subunit beta [Acidobacteriota bacterium]
MPELTYLQAIRQALVDEMNRDPTVLLLGEDIAQYGGAFKLTEGLVDVYGPGRVIDTPITEAGLLGAAAGAALMGLRPIVEMQFIDFISCAFNQLTNLVAKFHYRTGKPLPLVVRGPAGAGVNAGPFHSQSPEPYFLHTPGLKIVAPATPSDAMGLLKAAIRDPNPVIYLEYKRLYRRLKETIPPERTHAIVPIGEAAVIRRGSDISVLTYGQMVHLCLEAAQQLEVSDGIELEIVDLRTIRPLDERTILSSVRRTNKAMIVHEPPRIGGPAGEIIARINELAFDYLDGPILRVTAKDTPVPYSSPLEEAFLPRVTDIVDAARWLARF